MAAVMSRLPWPFGDSGGKFRPSFKEALAVLKAKIPGRDFRYKVPWFLLIGESGSGKTTLMDNVGLSMPLGRQGDPFAVRNACSWWFFTNGIVLDIDGSFILSEDGRSSDDASWRSFLNCASRYRPERPVDGIIIAIPSTDLIGPNKLSNEDVRRKADHIYGKIWQAQKTLGMTFPVYVVVTKCDNITGFRSFVSEFPERLQDDIFGWSTPYSIHNAYVPEWIDEAFRDLDSAIYKTQIEILAERDVVEDSDGVFLFPSEFQSMADPLRIYLSQFFKESAYHESFMFRGVYFSGDATIDAPAATALGGAYVSPAVQNAQKKPVFLKHLFEKKIFPESRLARPAAVSLLSRNRLVLAVQAACLAVIFIGGPALWLTHTSTKQDIGALTSVLTQIERDLSQIRQVEQQSSGQATSADVLRQLETVDSTKILTGLQNVNSAGLQRVFMPASWTSDVDSRVDRSLLIAFDRIVLGSMYLNLSQRIAQHLVIPPPAVPPAAFTVTRVIALPEFQALRTFVDQTRQFGEVADMYNFVARPDSGDLPTLGRLVKFIYGVELPMAFFENSEFYSRALRGSRQDVLNVEDLRRRSVEKLQRLGDQFFAAIGNRHLPIAQIDDLQMRLEGLAGEPTTADSDTEAYRALMLSIDQANVMLLRPEFAWLAKPAFDPAPEFVQLLDAVQQAPFLGPTARTSLEEMAATHYEQVQFMLQGYENFLTGPLIEKTDTGWKASMSVLALRTGLEGFLNQRFMAAPTARRIRTSPPQGSRFSWDLVQLQQAVQLVEPYNSFATAGLTAFRPELQSRLRVMALNRLEANMISIVSNAQRTEVQVPSDGNIDQDVETQAAQLRGASTQLSELLSTFDRLGFTRAYSDLSTAVLTGAYSQLRSVDQIFNEKLPYSFNQQALTRWDGSNPLVTVVFGVPDAAQAAIYLGAQRDNLRRLAKEFAAPALALIAAQRAAQRLGGADAQLVAKWRNISAEIDRFDNRNPANTISALESFAGTDIPALTVDNYLERIPFQNLNDESADFFLQQRNDLRRLVYQRFEAIATTRAVRQYREIETLFNQRLAGRFPFVAANAVAGPEVDPAAVREFFKLFDAYKNTVTAYFQRVPARTGSGLLEFMGGLAEVRTVLAPFLDDPKAVAPVFDFEVEFRVNRRRETAGNQVIEWTFEDGERRITARDSMRTGRWVSGDMVRVSLRWARDGVAGPLPPDAPNGFNVDDRTATFEYAGRWSILKMLRAHSSAPTDFDQLVDPVPYTLRFVIPTTQPAGANVAGAPPQARVFIRLTLLTATEKQPVEVPAFPVRAPSLNGT